MKFELLSYRLAEIPRVIELNNEMLLLVDGERKNLLKKATHKNLIIEIYTFWENYIKEIIYTCYKDYKKSIVDNKFLVKYLKSVQEKSYTRQLFFENIVDNKINITKENLCYSNNLNYEQLIDMFKRLGFDINDFGKHIMGNHRLELIIENLKECIIPVITISEHEKNLEDYVSIYIDFLVYERNKVAHQYEVDELFSSHQFKVLLEFIVELSNLVFEYCCSQLIKLSIEKDIYIVDRIDSIDVYKGNSRNTTAILGVANNTELNFSEKDNFFCYDPSKNIYRLVKIVKVVMNNTEINSINSNSKVSIEVESLYKFSKERLDFKILHMRHSSEEFEYALYI